MAEHSLQDYLASLEAQRTALSIQIAGVRAALGLEADDGASQAGGGPAVPIVAASRTVSPGHIKKDEFFKMSVPEAIQRYLQIMKQPQTPKDVADGLKAGGILSEAKHFYGNVFTALKRLRKQNVVVNTKSGGWGLAEWYAGRSGTNANGQTTRRKRKPGKAARKPKEPKEAKRTFAEPPARGYQAFIGQQMKAGKTMAQAAEEWRKKKGET